MKMHQLHTSSMRGLPMFSFTRLLILISSLVIYACAPVKQPLQSGVIHVYTAADLKTALKNAKEGDIIELADGEYIGKFRIAAGINGTKERPIILRGTAKAILQTPDTTSGYALFLEGNNYWQFKGFTIQNAKKGLVMDKSNNNLIEQLAVTGFSEEAIHIRAFSSYNIVKDCKVNRTGLTKPGFGEGVYIGSAVNNWPRHSDNKADTCNYNLITNCTFGPDIAAEAIDIKEGTTGNIIRGNTFYGKGQKGVNSGDSWMEVKGNYNIIEDNKGYDALKDGFQVTIKAEGWGAHNIFRNNYCEPNSDGYGINIQLLNGSPNGNVVYKNNGVRKAASGLTNIPPSE